MTRNRKGAKKPIGEIGSTKITAGPEGMTAEIIHTELPDQKEPLEKLFAEAFQAQFNGTKPLGDGITILNLSQNDTHDLDFKIDCEIADYLELAELNPRSEPFGREAYRTGRLNVYEYTRWIYYRVIRTKQRKYGMLCKRVILLLYVTHWQFLPSQRVFECLRGFLASDGCDFPAVFVLLTDGRELRHLELVFPFFGPKLLPPNAYKNFTLTNLEPGHFKWNVDSATDN